jgi:large subunit ribosomal protein L29
MKLSELKEKSKAELTDHLRGLYKEVFSLRLRRASQEMPNPLRLRTLRREIARVKTMLREDELGIRKLAAPAKTETKAKPKKGDKDA